MTSPDRIAKGMYWDRAWTLVEGCTPVSPGCANCWSAEQAHMRAAQNNPKIKARYEGLTWKVPDVPAQPVSWGETIPETVQYYLQPRFNGIVRPRWDALSLPASVKKPTTWAVWNDLFHEDVPLDFIWGALWHMLGNLRHTYLILTKRARRMANLIGSLNGRLPPHIWLGITAENQKMANLRIPELLKCNANRFVSVEPMLSPVDISRWLNLVGEPRIDWVVAGPETGKHKRPCDPAWIENLYAQCKAAGVPFFDKRKTGWLAREMPEGV